MIGLSASQCQVALKEWASVVQAFARGEQLVLIRKGGLAETRSGFAILSELFAFYPTFEHQAVTFLRSPYERYLDEALSRRPSEGMVRFELCGGVVWSIQQTDPTVIERLEPFHIYNQAFLHQRLKWQPDQPLVIAVVRALRLGVPQLLPVVSRYAGCKSWVDLEQAVSLDRATPVLDDETFAQRLTQLQSLLKDGGVPPRNA